MNVFTVIGIVGVLTAILTLLFAFAIYRLDAAVAENKVEIESSGQRYRPAQTGGFKIPVGEDKVVQFKEARVEAARRAAQLPRGANMRIGRQGAENITTASEELSKDPVSALKIAETQGWQGLGEFERYQNAATATSAAPVAATGGPVVKRNLVAGKDYEVIPVSASMSGPERRTARIANAKAKAAAYRAMKAGGADMVQAPGVPAAPAAEALPGQPAAPAAPSAAEVGIPEPDLIEITDDMDPADIRKARIANAKANSAYKKALKAAGVTSGQAAAQPAAAPPPAAAAPPPPADEPAGLADIPKPDLIEITDDMDPADIRSARIANSKAKSAYKKALKAAGIDPKSVQI